MNLFNGGDVRCKNFVRPSNHSSSGGFAVLVFVVIIAMSLLFMMIRYAENQKQIADNVREIIKLERSLQSALICVDYISSTLARYPLLNDDLISNIKNFSERDLIDKNYWTTKSSYSNYNQKGIESFECKVVDFNKCDTSACTYNAKIEGFNTFNGEDENNHSKVYMEWKIDDYRFYISKLKLIL